MSIANRLLLVSLVLYFTRLRAGQAQSRYAPCDRYTNTIMYDVVFFVTRIYVLKV